MTCVTPQRIQIAADEKARRLMLRMSAGFEDGAKDGARSRDNQIHNLGLYQLSYFRQWRLI